MATSASSPLPNVAGAGKVTDTQVAFMVECYLRDCHFAKTLDQFRSEAARVLQPLKSIPKGARSLSAVLNEYVLLKEQQIEFNNERSRVQALFKGLQEIVTVYQSVSNGDQLNAIASPVPYSSSASPSSQQIVETVSSPAEPVIKEGSGLTKRKSHVIDSNTTNSNEYCNIETANKKARRSSSSQTKLSASSLSPSPAQGTLMRIDYISASSDRSNNRGSVQPGTPPVKSEQRQAMSSTPASHSNSVSPSALQQQQKPNMMSPSRINTIASVSSAPPANHFLSPLRPNNSSPSLLQHGVADPSATAKLNNSSNSRQVNSAASGCTLRAPKESDFSSAIAKPSVASHKKKGGNSKCRLLDFSSASNVADTVVSSSMPSTVTAQIHASSCSSPSSSSSSGHIPPQLPLEACTEITQPQAISAPELPLSCDGVFFDDLFDLELDVDLISELEDLQPMNDVLGCASRPQASISEEDTMEKSCDSVESSPSDRKVLSEKGNLLGGHGDNFEGQCVLQMQDLVGSYSVSGSPNHSKALRRYSSSAVSAEKQCRDKENVASLPGK